jgi:hypothetical protein
LALLGLAGCSTEADFGRRPDSVVTASLLPGPGAAAAQGRGEPVSPFQLTDDEVALRDRAWRFLMPAAPRTRFDTTLVLLRTSRTLPADVAVAAPPTYFDGLMSEPWRSSKPPYRRMLDDIRADTALLDPYFAVLARVAAADGKRQRALEMASGLSPEVRGAAWARVAENQGLAWWVETALAARIAAYRSALTRLFVEIPEPDAVAVERALAVLEARAGLRPVAAAARSPAQRSRRGDHPWPTDEAPLQK